MYYQNTLHRLKQLEDSSEQRNLSDYYTLKKDCTFKHKVEGSFVVGKLQCAVSKDSRTADKKINPIVCLIEELDSLSMLGEMVVRGIWRTFLAWALRT